MRLMILRSRKGKSTHNKEDAREISRPTEAPITPLKKSESFEGSYLVDLSDELILQIIHKLNDERDCMQLAMVCRKTRDLVLQSHTLWRTLFLAKFANSSLASLTLLETAAFRAGGWQKFFSVKTKIVQEHPSQIAATSFEIEASVHHMLKQVLPNSPSVHNDIAIFFLIDGSGSVSESEFSEMKAFLLNVVAMLTKSDDILSSTIASQNTTASSSTAARKNNAPSSFSSSKRSHHHQLSSHTAAIRVGLIQFSSDMRLEFPLTLIKSSTANHPGYSKFESAVENLSRMNGGTNVAPAIQYAGNLFQEHAKESKKIVCIVTDGQFDPYQSKEAGKIAKKIDNEDSNGVNIHVFGIGRGADRQEIMRIIQSTRGMDVESDAVALRYLPVMTAEEIAW